jgi:hypothetical protein
MSVHCYGQTWAEVSAHESIPIELLEVELKYILESYRIKA